MYTVTLVLYSWIPKSIYAITVFRTTKKGTLKRDYKLYNSKDYKPHNSKDTWRKTDFSTKEKAVIEKVLFRLCHWTGSNFDGIYDPFACGLLNAKARALRNK